jgi:hypothetical protein
MIHPGLSGPRQIGQEYKNGPGSNTGAVVLTRLRSETDTAITL